MHVALIVYKSVNNMSNSNVNMTNEELMRRRRLQRCYQNFENSINGHKRVATPFRATKGYDDYLSRKNYFCEGSNPLSKGMFPGLYGLHLSRLPESNCDDTGIPGAWCNPKYIAPSSEYTHWKSDMAVARLRCDPNAKEYRT